MTDALWWAALVAGAFIGIRVLSSDHAAPGWTRRVAWTRALRRFWLNYREVAERRALLRRPWEEEFLHQAYDGHSWQRHGHLPSPGGRSRSTTSTGWCPGLRHHDV
ncbi:MAG TPA: hypothetical protein VE617_05490 [Propionibacteriaceae bacterium]|nr:hypothetical protein [Propionibacteriaceae bacterium]